MTTSQPSYGTYPGNPYDVDSPSTWALVTEPAVVPARTPAWKKVALAVAITVVTGSMIFGGIMLKAVHDVQVRNEEMAASASREAASSSAAAASSTRAAEREASAERSRRRAAVPGIEASVEEMADRHVLIGLIDGPVLSVACDPVTGGIEDISIETTTFNCFVATERLSGGQARGYNYHASMNWATGRYTYGFGAP